MIAELFFIVDLLTKRQLMAPSTPTISQPVVYDPDYDWQLKKPKVVPPVPPVVDVGQIVTIVQPVVLPPISGEDLTQWWLDATKDIPVTSLPPRAR